ncbi:hypothetical protein C461_12498 [Halorubrum aidingense JCM 13560]|uniref:Lipoprotein n=1 Tax=Halorubrum aidingense JCM 13560 TaxID=1230454 RepID=M0P829_9EURY|nr:hypothetical protein [Halorubrum aidingense]EMA65993.1 hypothetical protein C461_12498 [Halorubrum aidingense JCM 13560]
MHRRAVVVGALSVATAGCVDRLHDVAASTPRDLRVRSRYVDGNPLVDGQSVHDRPEELLTHAASFSSGADARAAVRPDAAATRAFVDETAFVDDGGGAVLVVAQRLAAPAVELRLGSISRTGDRSLRVAVEEAGVRGDPDVADDELVAKTLLLRLTDDRGPPARVVVSVDGDRAGVTI